MDSDDDYNSGMSSQEEGFEETLQESGDDSMDEGLYLRSNHSGCKLLITSLPDFEEDDPDMGFSQDKDIMKPRKRAYEVDFKIYTPVEIITQQNKQIDEVSAILGQPSEASAILLRYLRWNKERLIESYMDRPEAVLEKAGLGPDSGRAPKIESIRGFTCTICFDDEPGVETYAIKCGHRYCVDCYRQYLAQKILAEGEAARIQCPTEGCSRIVDSKSIDLLATANIRDR